MHSSPESHVFRAQLNDAASPEYTEIANAICNGYIMKAWGPISAVDNGYMAISNTGLAICISHSYSDTESFKTAMSGVMLVYELATPTSETATPYTDPQEVSANGTEQYVTTSIIPVGHETEYLELVEV